MKKLSREEAINEITDNQMESIFELVHSGKYDDVKAWIKPLLSEAIATEYSTTELARLYECELNREVEITDAAI